GQSGAAGYPWSLYTRCQYLKDAYRRAESVRKSGVAECERLAENASQTIPVKPPSTASGGGVSFPGRPASVGSSTSPQQPPRPGPVTLSGDLGAMSPFVR